MLVALKKSSLMSLPELIIGNFFLNSWRSEKIVPAEVVYHVMQKLISAKLNHSRSRNFILANISTCKTFYL